MPVVILDDTPGDERVYRTPLEIVRADQIEQVGGAFAAVEQALANGYHAAGYFSYELGYALEPRLLSRMPECRRVPLLWFGIFESCNIASIERERDLPRTHAGPLVHEWDRETYRSAFEHVQSLISGGDLYQANISHRARFAFAGSAYAFYRDLQAGSGARCCGYIDDGTRQILSLSPELFFSLDAEGCIVARPMKGTAARGATAEADARAVTQLRTSEKERAENLMIVDLLRNDISKIARAGSVRVENLFAVETYPTLHQMVSIVSGRLDSRSGVEKMVRALFPCGSVTGAPKLRAMEVIRERESSPRGVYCGAIGHFAPDGTARFNVAIRTLTIDDGGGEMGLGSAVVHDSRADAEYDECRLKARFFETVRKPVRLIETLRYSQTESFIRGELHLARMQASAGRLGIPYNDARARQALGSAVCKGTENMRVRLTLDENGTFESEAFPISDSPTLWRYVISSRRVESSDPLLRHKTSRRSLFDRERDRLAAETGCDEVLFVNENGELTEGSRSTIFVERGGRLYTPPIDCGLLDGCLRRELLDLGRCKETPLTRADLETASQVFLGNSLRGLIRATAL